jgi:hypothetical protein
MVLGSPEYVEDFLEVRYQESADENNVFRRRITAWDAKYPNYKGEYFFFNLKDLEIQEEPSVDTINIPILYETDFRLNPEKAIRELGATPTNSVCPFFSNFAILKRCYEDHNADHRKDPLPLANQGAHHPSDVKREILIPQPCFYNVLHCDMAWKFDACGIAVCSLIDFDTDGSPIINMDLALRLQGSKTNPLQFSFVREWIYFLKEIGFRLDMISFDGAQSVDMLQILESKGYETRRISVDIGIKPYTDLKETINAGRLIAYRNQKIQKTASNIMYEELKRLEEVQGRKIIHPPNFSKDNADALCGAVHSILLGCQEGRVSLTKCSTSEESYVFSDSQIF